MNDQLEILRELFEELSASNAMAARDYNEFDPIESYHKGKEQAYRLAAERVQLAIELNKVTNTIRDITFEATA